MNKLIIVNTDTGEVVDNCIIYTKEQIEQKKKYYNAKQELIRQQRDGFVIHYSDNDINISDISPQDNTRLIYLSTYISYDNNVLMTTERTSMTKSDMFKLLKLSKKQFYRFYNEMIERELLVEKDNGEILISDKYFSKGSISTKDYNRMFTRLYIDPIRQLYQTSYIKDHTALGYIFQLLPYYNKYTNILCTNPNEPDIKKLEKLRLSAICEILGYDKKNARRLGRSMSSIKFNLNGNKQHFILFVNNPDWDDWYTIINPNLMFSGDSEALRVAKVLFSAK